MGCGSNGLHRGLAAAQLPTGLLKDPWGEGSPVCCRLGQWTHERGDVCLNAPEPTSSWVLECRPAASGRRNLAFLSLECVPDRAVRWRPCLLARP